MIQFKNAAVAAKYESDRDTDPITHLPGGKNKNGWMGLLSEIPIEQADRWIGRPGQNIIKLKVIPKEAKASANGKSEMKES